MMKINSISWMRSKTLCFIPLAALALNASALPKKVSSVTIPGNKDTEVVFTDKKESADNDSIYGVMDELPMFPGGDQACANWVAKKLKYPPKCKKEKIEGFVIVQFVVEKNGKNLSYVMGERFNIKITTKEDLVLSRAILSLSSFS